MNLFYSLFKNLKPSCVNVFNTVNSYQSSLFATASLIYNNLLINNLYKTPFYIIALVIINYINLFNLASLKFILFIILLIKRLYIKGLSKNNYTVYRINISLYYIN